DDESRDGTAEIAAGLARADPEVRVLHRRGKKGYGEALTEGFRVAMADGAEVLATMDCDFSHDPADLPRLLAALDDASAAIGSRYVEGGGIRDWPPHRRLLSGTANTFVRVLFALPARDCTSGFRAYRRSALEAVPWGRLHSAGYSFLVEVLFWVCCAGHRCVEVPILFVDRKRGKSKMGLQQIVAGAANLLRVRLALGRRPR
ncbi:MAG TPA: glycosyltransferase, partial [Vicinamibacteria bacterium]|nr:glycosyltransferase [Vicinamibacteria bacterium]